MTSSLLPLKFRIAPRLSLPSASSTRNRAFSTVPAYLTRAANARDFYTCRFCGFYSLKYQRAVALDPAPVDIAAIVTACIFCAQCMDLARVPAMRSGLAIWLPRVSQIELNRAAKELYALRVTADKSETASAVLNALTGADAAPRKEAAAMLGDRPLEALIDRVRTGELKDDQLAGLRLLPIDRLIMREADLEYNQFPQILAYWRSKDGPIKVNAGTPDFDRLLELMPELARTDLNITA